MKFSIIIPSYNRGKFIRRAINSILSQQHVDLEILVFDRGSTDQTLEILNSYGNQNQLHWVSEQGLGHADAINKGLAIASGDIHAYLNPEDVLCPGALKKVEDAFGCNPTVRILYGDADYIDEKGNFIKRYHTEKWDYNRLFDFCFICQPATFWKKEIILEYGVFDDSLNYSMNYEYWLRVGAKEPIFYLKDEKLANFSFCLNKMQRVAMYRESLQVVRRYTHTPYSWLRLVADTVSKKRSWGWKRDYGVNVIKLSSEYSIPLDGIILSELLHHSFPKIFQSVKLNQAIYEKVNKMSRYNLRAYWIVKNFVFMSDRLLKQKLKPIPLNWAIVSENEEENNKAICDKIDNMSRYNLRAYWIVKNFVLGADHLLKYYSKQKNN